MRSPGARKELHLQGPRPTALKINKDSQLIKKQPLPHNVKPPRVIYTVSPKIITTDAKDFKDLVQRLTGKRSPKKVNNHADADVSTAATYAALQKANNSPEINNKVRKRQRIIGGVGDMAVQAGGMQGMETMAMGHMEASVERAAYFPMAAAGILSPAPSSLLGPVCSGNMFTPPVDLSPFSNFCQDLSPVYQSQLNHHHPNIVPTNNNPGLQNFNHPHPHPPPPNLSSQDSLHFFPDFL